MYLENICHVMCLDPCTGFERVLQDVCTVWGREKSVLK